MGSSRGSPIALLAPGAPAYPRHLTAARWVGNGVLQTLGKTTLMQDVGLGIVCSRRIPGRLLLETYEWAQRAKRGMITVAAGFHSPMERECLRILLEGNARIVVCPARSLVKLRVPVEWRPALEEERLAVVSPFSASIRRATRDLASERNRFVALLARAVLLPHATRGGLTERLAAELIAFRTPVFTFGGPENDNLIRLGVRPWDWEEWRSGA